jgi:hypothetical protein
MDENEIPEKVFVTGDKKVTTEEVDKYTSGGMHVINSMEEFMEMCRLATARKAEWDAMVGPAMTLERAGRIKELRKTESWRAVAGKCFQEWGRDAQWYPFNSQIAGMSLCEAAAKVLGEDYDKEPWTTVEN